MKKALITNAIRRWKGMSMPAARAENSSSRAARSARPKRERW
jgi:hypothetical protein